LIDTEKYLCVGIEINANHVRGVKNGLVTATCKRLHAGSFTHVWDIHIHDDNKRLLCVSRLTVAVLPKKRVFN
jgi:1,4-dihydroxy-2-naphthoyl-CoA hydrolase